LGGAKGPSEAFKSLEGSIPPLEHYAFREVMWSTFQFSWAAYYHLSDLVLLHRLVVLCHIVHALFCVSRAIHAVVRGPFFVVCRFQRMRSYHGRTFTARLSQSVLFGHCKQEPTLGCPW